MSADGANVAAMIVMALVNLTLLTLAGTKILNFAWSWLVILGAVGTIVLALGPAELWRSPAVDTDGANGPQSA